MISAGPCLYQPTPGPKPVFGAKRFALRLQPQPIDQTREWCEGIPKNLYHNFLRRRLSPTSAKIREIDSPSHDGFRKVHLYLPSGLRASRAARREAI